MQLLVMADKVVSFIVPSRRDVIGIAVCALATGPIALASVAAWAAVMFWPFVEFGSPGERDLIGIALVFGLSVVYGLAGGLPAAILNSFLHLALVKRHVDAPVVSALSGGAIGAALGYVALSVATYDPRYETSLHAMYPLGISGAILGLLYWSIAIKPRRNARLMKRHDPAMTLPIS